MFNAIRWIGQHDLAAFIQQYEWFWTAKYNDFDLQVFIPIKANMKTIYSNRSIKNSESRN